jgi:hypothetical protein
MDTQTNKEHIICKSDFPFWKQAMKFNIIGARVRVTSRLAVYRQSIRLGDKPLETHDQYFSFN